MTAVADTRPPRRRRRWPLITAVTAAVVVVIAVVAVVLVNQYANRKPPPLAAGGPDVFRLTAVPAGIPERPQVMKLSNGGMVGLAFYTATTVGGKPAATIGVRPDDSPALEMRTSTPPQRLTLTQGQSGTVGSLRIQMLTVWSEPSSSNDAADVRVTPAG